MNVTTRNQNLCDKSQLHRRSKRMLGQPQIFNLVVALLKFREFPDIQHTDQNSQQMYRTSIDSCILSWKNASAGVIFQYNCRLQSSNFTASRFLCINFSRTSSVAFSREFSKALHISMIMNNIYIYIYIYIYICRQEKDVSSRSPQWLCGKLCTWAHNVRLQHYSLCAHVHELPQSHSGDNRECPLFS